MLKHSIFVLNRNLVGVDYELPEAIFPPKNTDEVENNQEKKKPDPFSDTVKAILAGSISPDGRWMALCDDRKQITLWNTVEWTLAKQWPLQRKANRVIFSPDSSAVLVADKGGDVIKFDVEASDGVCILGHLSMLLDVTMSECGHYIVTCDRDEKIRVSRYPNAYNIHNFCLGHAEFVSGIVICPHRNSILVSASGDGTIRIWDFLTGNEINSKLLCEDLPEPLRSIPDASNEKNGSSESRVKRSTIPGLTSLRCKQVSDEQSLVLVTVENFDGILIYMLAGEEGKLTFLQRISTEKNLWDFGFDPVSGDLVILVSNENIFRRFRFSVDQFSEIETNIPESARNELGLFFEAARSCTRPGTEDLYKKWFDNVNEYLEKKEQRIKAKHDKSANEVEPKRIKL